MSLLNRIRKIFEKIECPPLYILKTPRAGEEVDNGCGLDFDLPPYAVIFEGDIEEDDNELKKLKKLYAFSNRNDIEIQHFDVKNLTSVEDFLKELHDLDGYEIIWDRKREQAKWTKNT